MTEWVTTLITELGYGGIALLMFVEIVFPPIPSEFILPFAGFAASQGTLDPVWVIVSAVGGSLLGSQLIYLFGRLMKDEQLERFIERYGRKIGLRLSDLEKSRRWFDRYGVRAVLVGRIVPGVRSIISLPAGLRRMNLITFLFATTIGYAFWSVILVVLGYALGSQYKRVGDFLGPISSIFFAIVLVAGTIWIWRRTKLMQKDGGDDPISRIWKTQDTPSQPPAKKRARKS